MIATFQNTQETKFRCCKSIQGEYPLNSDISQIAFGRAAFIIANFNSLMSSDAYIYILNKIHTCSFKKMHLIMSSVKWQPFCLSLNELSYEGDSKSARMRCTERNLQVQNLIKLESIKNILKFKTQTLYSFLRLWPHLKDSIRLYNC